MNISPVILRTKSKQKAPGPKAEQADLPWDDEEDDIAPAAEKDAEPAAPARRGLWGAMVRSGTRRRRGRVFIFVAALLVIAIGGVLVILASGGTDFGALRGRIKQTIEASIGPGFDVEVGKTSLGFDPVLGLAVTIDDVIIRDPGKSIAADIPSTRLAIDLWSIFSRHGLVRAVEVNGATLLLSRSADGHVQLGEPPASLAETRPLPEANAIVNPIEALKNTAGEGENAGGFPDLFAALQILDRGLDPAIATALRSGFERFTMSNSTISIKDAREVQPRLFLRTDLGAAFESATKKVTLTFATSGYSGRWTANAERTVDPKTSERTLSATFSQLTIADLFPVFGQENSAVSSDIPLYGRATIRLAEDGAVTDATLRLDAGSGAIRFKTEQDYMLIDEATLRLRWDVPNDLFVIDQSTIVSGRTQAVVNGWIRPVGDAAARKYEFNFDSQGAVLAPRDSPEQPLLTQRISVSGTADVPGKLVEIENAMVLSPAGNVSAAGSIGFEGRTPSVAMAVNFSPMPVAALKQLWPPFLAGGARRWVLSHVSGGQLVNGRIEAAIPSGLLWTGKRVRVPDDAFRMDFRMEDVSFTTIGTVPEVTKASGNGSLVGSTFGLDVEKGEVVTSSGKRATITSGLFAIPDMVPRFPEARVELQMTGDAGAFGEIANAEPFGALSKRDIDPTGFAGNAKASLSATWPLRPGNTADDLAWRVRVDVEGFSSDKPIEGHTVSNGTVQITVDRDVAAISGKALIDGVPAAVSLAQPMTKDGVAPTTDGKRQFRLALGGPGSQRLGSGLDEIIVGTITASVTDLPGKTGTHYDIDLTRARVVLSAVGWTKGIGVPARLSFDLVPSGANYKVNGIDLSGTGFEMGGSAVVDKDYSILSADIDKLSLRKGDSISLKLKRDNGANVVTVRGKQLDLRGLIAQFRSPDDFSSTIPDLSLDAKVDTVIGNNNEVLQNAALVVKARQGTVNLVDLKGSLSNTPFAASYVDDERGTRVSMTSTDAGKFFRFVDLYTRGIGGQIRLAGQSIGPDGPLTGVFDVTNFAVLNEPAMQTVVAGPQGRQQAQPVSAQFDPRRVPFDRMLINFTKRDSTLVIDDAMLAGPALGANLAGSIDFATSRLSFAGTYIPAYAFNNLFGKLPIIGIILGGGSREGLFGVTFKVDGTLSDPRLTVNALSAITPGIFRKIFEFQQGTPRRAAPPVYPNAPIPQQ